MARGYNFLRVPRPITRRMHKALSLFLISKALVTNRSACPPRARSTPRSLMGLSTPYSRVITRSRNALPNALLAALGLRPPFFRDLLHTAIIVLARLSALKWANRSVFAVMQILTAFCRMPFFAALMHSMCPPQ